MLNTNHDKAGDFNSELNVSAVSGTIVKNYKDSFLKRFHMRSEFAKSIFDEDGPHIFQDFVKRPAVIIQCMACGDGELICEIMWEEDFDEIFKTKKTEEKGE
ncbi:MAG: hypothetical protein Q4P25_06030 [Tissierellia bacterium]|nr:hypothetical protein [Tissierellia bacterium]